MEFLPRNSPSHFAAGSSGATLAIGPVCEGIASEFRDGLEKPEKLHECGE